MKSSKVKSSILQTKKIKILFLFWQVEYKKQEIQVKINQFKPESKIKDKQRKQHGDMPDMSAFGIVGEIVFIFVYSE